MRSFRAPCGLALGVVLGLALAASAADVGGLKSGSVELKSVGPITFGPEGIMLVSDPMAATIYAIDTRDSSGDPSTVAHSLENVEARVAKLLGVEAADVRIVDLAVNPASGNVYLAVSNGKSPALVRISDGGELSEVSLKNVPFSKATLGDAPENKVVRQGRRARNRRGESITDLAYVEGSVLVSGLSNASSASAVRSLAFPPSDADKGTSLEIFHGAHGKLEDYAAIRTFVPFAIDGKAHVLAAYTCTPLVKFPVEGLVPGEKLRGTTIAELGNRNRPLDMIVYKKDGKEFLLMANSARGVMKISTDNIGEQEPITKRVPGGGIAGQSYETVKELQGVVQLDRLNEGQAVVLQTNESKGSDLRTIDLP